jgi:hypothetical protein
MSVAAVGALGFGGATLADAATGNSSASSSSAQGSAATTQPQRDPRKAGGHVGANTMGMP